MALFVTLGGDRIGSGNQQKVEMHNYMMNSFNLEQDFKSSMAPGVLYPFIKMVGTNHGTFDIDLDTFVRTIPTRGPLFGSFKLQLDLYSVPFRLYQGVLHNNPVDIGLKMNQVYLPKLEYTTIDGKKAPRAIGSNDYNYQVNESALVKYLGLSGIGKTANYAQTTSTIKRKIQCVPLLGYYDIFKCYYSNKQEENAYVITPKDITQESLKLSGILYESPFKTRTLIPYLGENVTIDDEVQNDDPITFTFLFKTPEGMSEFELTEELKTYILEEYAINIYEANTDEDPTIYYNLITYNEEYDCNIEWKLNNNPDNTKTIQLDFRINNLDTTIYKFNTTNTNIDLNIYTSEINLEPFALKNIDDMRNFLLSNCTLGTEVVLGKSVYHENETNAWTEESGSDGTGLPYSACFKTTEYGINWNAFIMNGLVVKTYQSDLFNNWLDSEYIDGEEGISAITAVSTTGGSFTMDSLNLAEKFYELLNRILISGGTYQDWQEAVYGEGAIRLCETPMYIGGMSAEIMFEEVISSAETNVNDDRQALGSLAGKGTQIGKKGGNSIHVKMDEPGYIMGIVSITPRICYSQGNDWDLTELDTLDDLHKPALDGIGFQPLMIEQFAWWNTVLDGGTILYRGSAGKQTAWINYQTAVDKCYGDFAKQDGYAFMVLNRNYEIGETPTSVKDITTYIDPAKFNYAFAYTDLAAQNFWVQVHSKVTARRKMGAQQIPNL